ncbi:MAG: hypothetical protein Q9160_001330 [Pyrenula sp. 1 TL-2023]
MSSLKRSWEGDDDEQHIAGGYETYRADKRPRVHDFKPLPFRTSPTSKYTSLYSQNHSTSRPYPSTLTPVESDDDDGNSDDCDLMVPDTPNDIQSSHMTRDTHGLSIKVSSGNDGEHDMEMSDNSPTWQDTIKEPALSPMGPPPQPAAAMNNTGRIPTPIYGHFNTHLLQPSAPSNFSANNSNIARTTLSIHPTSSSDWRLRGRLPSPVYDESEYEDNDVDVDEPMSPAMGEAIDQLKIHTPGQAPPSFPNNFDRGHSALFERRASANGQRPRGGAVSSGSRLMMGFKPDCEKCVRRVPGHYAHIVRD